LVAIDKDGKLYDGTVNQKKRCEYYLLKFDSNSNSDRDHKDPKGMTKIEYIYSLIAANCGINMPQTSFIENEEDFHFLIKRFDRIDKEGSVAKDRLHYVSWSGMAHAHRDSIGAYSYEQLVSVCRQMNLGEKAILEIFKRAIFNIVGRNQDDHTKNFGFLMNKQGQWSLSPAFDMTYSYDPSGMWTKNHQINLNGKNNNFTKDDIVAFGNYCNLKEKKSIEILENTIKQFKKFEQLADEYKVDTILKNTILKNIRFDL
jgi:serine/threonine-protein kinase HipA